MPGPARFATTSLQDLLDAPEAGAFAKASFVVVQNTATLAEVKERMMQQTQSTGASCEDAFVTPPGNARVEGWITSDIIDRIIYVDDMAWSFLVPGHRSMG